MSFGPVFPPTIKSITLKSCKKENCWEKMWWYFFWLDYFLAGLKNNMTNYWYSLYLSIFNYNLLRIYVFLLHHISFRICKISISSFQINTIKIPIEIVNAFQIHPSIFCHLCAMLVLFPLLRGQSQRSILKTG